MQRPPASKTLSKRQYAPQRPVDGPRPIKKIAIVNHKGGVGKTSTTVHLSGALAGMGYRVLICDCDSQGDLSAVYVRDHEHLPHTIADIFGGNGPTLEQLIQPTTLENIFVVPADDRLNLVDQTHSFENDPRVLSLADGLRPVEKNFDFILFDCPPRAHLSGFAALVAAGEVLIPCQPSQFSIRSMSRLMREIDAARQYLNPQLAIRGYFLSMVSSRSATQQKYRDMLVQALGSDAVLRTAIPTMATFDSSINLGRPVTVHSPRSKASEIMTSFALELLGVPYEHHAKHSRAAA